MPSQKMYTSHLAKTISDGVQFSIEPRMHFKERFVNVWWIIACSMYLSLFFPFRDLSTFCIRALKHSTIGCCLFIACEFTIFCSNSVKYCRKKREIEHWKSVISKEIEHWKSVFSYNSVRFSKLVFLDSNGITTWAQVIIVGDLSAKPSNFCRVEIHVYIDDMNKVLPFHSIRSSREGALTLTTGEIKRKHM